MPSSPTSPTSSTTSTAPSQPPTTRKRVTPEHTLSRVRENQRRHRARRRDYIATLEDKLAETERQLHEARAEIAALREERERGVVVLPCVHGEYEERRRDGVAEAEGEMVVDGNGDEQRMDGGENGLRDKTEEIYALGITESASSSVANTTTYLDPTTFYNITTLPSPLPSPTNTSIDMDLAHDLAHDLTHLPSPSPSPPSSAVGPPPCCEDPLPSPLPTSTLNPLDPECSTCKTRPLPLPTESTTLCAQAYVLISQQNFRSVDAATIRLWLYRGYRRAQRRGEGCRVENGALFRLLDFISGV